MGVKIHNEGTGETVEVKGISGVILSLIITVSGLLLFSVALVLMFSFALALPVLVALFVGGWCIIWAYDTIRRKLRSRKRKKSLKPY